MDKRIVTSLLGAAILAAPAAAVADPGHGKGHQKHSGQMAAKGKSSAKRVTYVFKGTYAAPGVVTVTSGNAHVRKGGFVGQQVAFDFAAAKVVVADANADLKADLRDVADGDAVLVQARIARRTQFAAPAEGETATAIVARKLVDKTNPPVDDDAQTAPAQ